MTDSLNFDQNKETEEEKSTQVTEAENKAKWYVVHTYTGYENRVSDKIQMMIDNDQNPDIVDVTVPTEEYVDVKNNSKKLKTRKLFPGYVMVKMVHTSKTWYIIRNTQGVTGFVGPDGDPVPLTPDEVRKFGIKEKKPVKSVEINFKVGDQVEITNGVFTGDIVRVEEIDLDKEQVKVYTDVFGQDTITTLDIRDAKTI